MFNRLTGVRHEDPDGLPTSIDLAKAANNKANMAEAEAGQQLESAQAEMLA